MLITVINCACFSGFAFACQASPDLILWFISFGKKLPRNFDTVDFYFFVYISKKNNRSEANVCYISKSCPAGVGDDKRSSGVEKTLTFIPAFKEFTVLLGRKN